MKKRATLAVVLALAPALLPSTVQAGCFGVCITVRPPKLPNLPQIQPIILPKLSWPGTHTPAPPPGKAPPEKKVPVPMPKVTCTDVFHCRITNVPDPVTALAKGVDHTIKRNTKTVAFLGRAVACYYTYCASELYIARRNKEAREEAQQQLDQFRAEAAAEATREGTANNVQFLQKQLEASQALVAADQTIVDDASQRLEGLTQYLPLLEAESKLRDQYAARHEQLPPGNPAMASLAENYRQNKDIQKELEEKANELNIGTDEVMAQVLRLTDDQELQKLMTSVAGAVPGVTKEKADADVRLKMDQATESALQAQLAAIQAPLEIKAEIHLRVEQKHIDPNSGMTNLQHLQWSKIGT